MRSGLATTGLRVLALVLRAHSRVPGMLGLVADDGELCGVGCRVLLIRARLALLRSLGFCAEGARTVPCSDECRALTRRDGVPAGRGSGASREARVRSEERSDESPSEGGVGGKRSVP